ncbi:MAG: hypothetical protein KC680_00100, partial [Candidatus Peregrinibacteria bacterium]|nr:hypothetical protein [Candidatus Peregrinibacteria bacterium]
MNVLPSNLGEACLQQAALMPRHRSTRLSLNDYKDIEETILASINREIQELVNTALETVWGTEARRHNTHEIDAAIEAIKQSNMTAALRHAH